MALNRSCNILERETKEYIKEMFSKLTWRKVTPTIPEIAEKHRYVSGAFPGLYSYNKTPYMLEIAELASATSPYTRITVMASAQSGKTSGVMENGILYWTNIGEPSNVLYMTATEQLAKDFVQERIDPMFSAAQIELKSEMSDEELRKAKMTKKTGNTSLKKNGIGFTHVYKSFGNIREVRSLDFRVVLLDEVDEMQQTQNRHKQGSFIKVIEARTRSYAGKQKIIICSTPLLAKTSFINSQFLQGDQRYCHIKCPYCDYFQKIEFKNLKWEYKDKEKTEADPQSVHLKCIKNKCKIKNYDKSKFLHKDNIKWIAENKEGQPLHASFHFSALYCPLGMTSWEEIAQEFLDSRYDADHLQAFFNLTLGLPFDDIVSAQKPEALNALKESYKSGTLPMPDAAGLEPMVATMGADVQGDRIEAELVGHSSDYHSWSLGYYVFQGSTSHYASGAFKKFRDFLISGQMPMTPKLVFIDSRYMTQQVYHFCNDTAKLRPIMGEDYIKGSKFAITEIKQFKGKRGPLPLYRIDTNSYKRNLYQRLLLRRDKGTSLAPPGYCRFPKDASVEFFKMLQSEDQIADIDKNTGRIKKYIFSSRGKRNEALDCRVYASCALDVLAYNFSLQKNLKNTDIGLFWRNVEAVYKVEKAKKEKERRAKQNLEKAKKESLRT